MANDLEADGHILQHLGDIFSKLLQLALADRTALFLRSVLTHFATGKGKTTCSVTPAPNSYETPLTPPMKPSRPA